MALAYIEGFMDKLFLSLNSRVLVVIVILISIVSWFTLCQKYYDSYWNGTIKRVQTVDFNILHHTLPTTLSYLILSGQDKAIQDVLDANYGIFGIVVTDPKGENIVYKSEKIYKHKTWQKLLSPEYVRNTQTGKEIEHFDWLTNPPPDHAEYANDSPRVAGDKKIAPEPEGKIIGRVYYLREPPPPFLEDMVGALGSNWFELSGSKRGYVLQTLNVLSFSLLITLVLLWRKQVLTGKERELASLEKELVIKRRALETLTADLATQRKRKQFLEQEAERAYQRATRLKESLQKLKDAFFVGDGSSPGVRASAQMSSAAGSAVSVRPPDHPPSAVIEEIESLLPDLTNNAKILRSQAEVLQSYCAQLEMRQQEMQQILERRPAPARAQAAPAAAHVRTPFAAEQSAP